MRNLKSQSFFIIFFCLFLCYGSEWRSRAIKEVFCERFMTYYLVFESIGMMILCKQQHIVPEHTRNNKKCEEERKIHMRWRRSRRIHGCSAISIGKNIFLLWAFPIQPGMRDCTINCSTCTSIFSHWFWRTRRDCRKKKRLQKKRVNIKE